MRLCTLLLSLLTSQALFGQMRHQVSAEFIGQSRVGEGSYPIAGTHAGFGGAYSLRAHRQLQIDLGVEVVPRPIGSGVDSKYTTNIEDTLYLIPFGGRVLFGPEDGRWEFGVGGGGAYMNHRVGVPGYGLSGATGPGGYALVGGNLPLRKGSRFRFGANLRYYMFSVSGWSTGRGRFLTFGPEFSFRF